MATPSDLTPGNALDPARRGTLRTLGGWLALAGGWSALGAACGGSAEAAPSIPIRTQLLNGDLASPWGMAFLPDGRILVSQKGGTMVLLGADGRGRSAPLAGVPAVVAAGQGGLLDVVLDPDFAADPWVYWAYSEAGAGGSGTAVARGRLAGNGFTDVAVILRQTPKVSGNGHFGCRLVFKPDDKTLFVTLGDRQQDSPSNPTTAHAQNPAKSLGKVMRIARDGSIPADNPAFGAGALPGLWSTGHRNPQGAAIRPGTNELWLVEHGPRGGDELNRVIPGRNYGWPLRSYGCDYSFSQSAPACRPGGGTHAPDFEEPVATWQPVSTAPSGLAFVTSDRFPEWRGHVLVGALAGRCLWRVALSGNAEAGREQLLAALGERIRCVQQGPDGWIYLLTDNGRLFRLER